MRQTRPQSSGDPLFDAENAVSARNNGHAPKVALSWAGVLGGRSSVRGLTPTLGRTGSGPSVLGSAQGARGTSSPLRQHRAKKPIGRKRGAFRAEGRFHYAALAFANRGHAGVRTIARKDRPMKRRSFRVSAFPAVLTKLQNLGPQSFDACVPARKPVLVGVLEVVDYIGVILWTLAVSEP